MTLAKLAFYVPNAIFGIVMLAWPLAQGFSSVLGDEPDPDFATQVFSTYLIISIRAYPAYFAFALIKSRGAYLDGAPLRTILLLSLIPALSALPWLLAYVVYEVFGAFTEAA